MSVNSTTTTEDIARTDKYLSDCHSEHSDSSNTVKNAASLTPTFHELTQLHIPRPT